MKKSRGIFLLFLRIGFVTIGGGYVMLPMIQRELVDRRRWITDAEFVQFLTIAQSAPGVMVVNLAVAVGRRVAGLPGAVAALLGTALPSLVSIVLVARFFLRWFDAPAVRSFFAGATPAVSGVIAAVVWTMGRRFLRGGWRVAALVGAALPLIFWSVNPILVMVIGVASSLLTICREPAA